MVGVKWTPGDVSISSSFLDAACFGVEAWGVTATLVSDSKNSGLFLLRFLGVLGLLKVGLGW
jgi:hypothetical protein